MVDVDNQAIVSSMLLRFTDDTFDDNLQSTIGKDDVKKVNDLYCNE